MMLETHMKLCMTELNFPEKNFSLRNWNNGQKWAKNRVFLNILKNFVITFY